MIVEWLLVMTANAVHSAVLCPSSLMEVVVLVLVAAALSMY
jgi:hypothetical protein